MLLCKHYPEMELFERKHLRMRILFIKTQKVQQKSQQK